MRKRVILGAAVKAIREAQGRKGAQFSIDCLMTPGHLCNIEQGRKQPPAETVYRIAAMLRVPVDAISYEIESASEAIA